MMKRSLSLLAVATSLLALGGCSRVAEPKGSGEVGWDQSNAASARSSSVAGAASTTKLNPNLGFDRNDYPGDETMLAMRQQFGFTGFWLNAPPGAESNNWHGKRTLLRAQGWGFLVLFNGRLDAEILKAQKKGTPATELGRKDAAAAIAAAKAEGFPNGTIVFLDQEEGGRLLEEQAAYLLSWTEAVASSAYKPGVYASAQPVSDEPGTTIDTVRDIRARVKAQHLHEVGIFAAQDQCPPAPGCTAAAKPLSSAGEPDLIAWQYAQSPRRPEITQSCAQTYAADGNCYAQGFPGVFLDLNIASSPDPSHGR